MIPTVRPATKSASRYFRILYFFIIPQNGKSSVQKARESCRVQEHFGIFSPIFFSTRENPNVDLIFFRTFSCDFFRTCVRNFPLGRFSSISVLRTSGSMIFKLRHNAKKKIQLYHVLSRPIMRLSFCYSKFLFTRCALDEGNILFATFHKSPKASQKIGDQRLIYLSPTIAMFCGELSVKNLPIKARTGRI